MDQSFGDLDHHGTVHLDDRPSAAERGLQIGLDEVGEPTIGEEHAGHIAVVADVGERALEADHQMRRRGEPGRGGEVGDGSGIGPLSDLLVGSTSAERHTHGGIDLGTSR